jgi:hypothetical protein
MTPTSVWERVRGHAAQVELFRRSVRRGRLAQGYLFVGPEGVGKRMFARALAQGLFCREVPDDEVDACGSCPDCKQVISGSHPDLLTVGPPEGKSVFPIDVIAGPKDRRGREGLCYDLSLRPMMADRRVAIVDNVHLMNAEAANAFLKTLEEPPARTVMILALPTSRASPATILSRCQPVRFAVHRDTAAIESVTAALELLGDVRAGGAEAMLRRTQRVDRAKAETLVDGFWRLARDLLVSAAGAPAALLTAPDRAEDLAREAAGWSDDELLAVIALCREARDGLLRNVAPGLTMEVVLSRVALRAA